MSRNSNLVIIYLIIKNNKEKENNEAESEEHKKIIEEQLNKIVELENSSIYFQNAYISSSNWAQQLATEVPNPEEAMKDLIAHLTKIKTEIFHKEDVYSKELDSAIGSLKMNLLPLSFGVLAKIVENLFEKSLLQNQDFRLKYPDEIRKNKPFTLGKMLRFAEEKGFLLEEMDFLKVIRDLRNVVVHELTSDMDKILLIVAHKHCIEIIEKIIYEPWFNTDILEKTSKQPLTELS